MIIIVLRHIKCPERFIYSVALVLKKWFERNAAKVKRRRITELPSLRRHYPDQVLRVLSQHPGLVVTLPGSTPGNLKFSVFLRADKDTNIIFLRVL